MAKPVRTFVALDISPAVRRRTLKLIDELRTSGANVRWVEAENLHITMKFLGDVDPSDLSQVCQAVQRAAATIEPYELQSYGAGAFPNLDRPRIVWLGVGEGAEQTGQLFDAIDASLAEIGFAREQRKFRPHLTLGRVRRAWQGTAELAHLLRQRADYDAGRSDIGEAVVYASQLGRQGPRYEAIGHLPLLG